MQIEDEEGDQSYRALAPTGRLSLVRSSTVSENMDTSFLRKKLQRVTAALVKRTQRIQITGDNKVARR